MNRVLTMSFAVAAYLLFFATFLYLIGFVADLAWLPRTVDRGPETAPAFAVVINLALIAVFGLQHSIMARQGFKRWWMQFVPAASERSVYVVASSLALIILFAGWQPIRSVVWSLDGTAAWLVWGVFALGWAVVLTSTYLISHFELFGLTQAWQHWRGQTAPVPQFRQPLFYRLVRHPLYTGFLIAFWAAPVMTVGHLLLAAWLTVYVVAAIRFEERDLVALFGSDYAAYQKRVGMLTPRLRAT